jgi:hypothetical protein
MTTLPRCATCRFWKQEPSSDDAWSGNVISLMQASEEAYAYYDLSDEDALRVTNELRQRLGECKAPKLHFFTVPSEGEAAIMDGSGYRANLITTSTFGCTMHEAKE